MYKDPMVWVISQKIDLAKKLLNTDHNNPNYRKILQELNTLETLMKLAA